jgi:hypothetical protein
MMYLKAFAAGFLSTLIFHQGVLAVLHAAGATERAPYSMEPTAPLQVPQVLSLAFWGGIWGILLWLAIRGVEGSSLYWVFALVLGALAPSIVALFVVFPLKGSRWRAAGGRKFWSGLYCSTARGESASRC